MNELIADSLGPVVDLLGEAGSPRVSDERTVPAEVVALTRSLVSIEPSLRGRPGLRGCGGSGI